MGDIYANSFCTIAATASKDSNGGLFFERIPESILPQVIQFDWTQNLPGSKARRGTFLCDVGQMAQRYIEEAPLNKRAWVSQERQLSTRLIHFTSGQLFWECREMTACETYREGLPVWAQGYWMEDGNRLKRCMRSIAEQERTCSEMGSTAHTKLDSYHRNIYIEWLAFRDLYSRCALTNPSDKLFAIRGIGNWIGRAIGDEMVAGLWRGRIVEELCWSKRGHSPETEMWRAPTWSWAFSNDEIVHSSLTRNHGHHSSRHITGAVVNLDVRSKTSGELEHASMRIKCRLLYAVYNHGNSTSASLRLRNENGSRYAPEPGTLTGISWPDFNSFIDKPWGEIRSMYYGYVLLIQYCLDEAHADLDWRTHKNGDVANVPTSKHRSSQDCAEALFVQTHDNITFERAGLFTFYNYPAVHWILDAHNLAEDRVITLI